MKKNPLLIGPETSPNAVECWGPNQMLFFRNVRSPQKPVDQATQASDLLKRRRTSGSLEMTWVRTNLSKLLSRPRGPKRS